MKYDNTNRGAIWKNDSRRPDKNDPHFQGMINVSTSCPSCNNQISIDQQVSAWKPDPEKAGPKTPVLSMSMRDKVAPQQSEPAPESGQDVNSEIPF